MVARPRCSFYFVLFIIFLPASTAIWIKDKFVDGYASPDQESLRRQHLLQECQAELPHECPPIVKALDQNCTSDKECLPPAECFDLKCRCPDGFLPSGGVCTPAGLDRVCVDGLCAPPFVCTRGTCVCPSGTDPVGNECQPRCNEGELPFNGTCVELENVGGRCVSYLQCQTAFSHCRNEKCECIPGTKERNGECEPTYTCPDGRSPLQDDRNRDEPVKCSSLTCSVGQFIVKPTKLKLDTCPDGSYCVFPSYQNLVGFCCPEQAYCPVGEPLPDKTCVDPRSERERCPPETHHCYLGLRGPACCPLPCPSLRGLTVVVEKGACYPRKGLGDQCRVGAQCPPPSTCEGTCVCPVGHLIQFGPGDEEKCVKICQPGRVLVGSECLVLSVPSGQCNHSSQCTADSVCVKGRCECPCGKILYNGNCISQPQCPDFGKGVYDPLIAGDGAPMECSPSAITVVNASCPSDHFCYPAAVYSGGICCPLPSPSCHWGEQPPRDRQGRAQFCQLPALTRRGETCPRRQYCHDYSASLSPTLAGLAADRAGVCCWESPQQYKTITRTIIDNGPCPQHHRPLVLESGGAEPRKCNYYDYAGECGSAGCFLPIGSEGSRVHDSGVCCMWQE